MEEVKKYHQWPQSLFRELLGVRLFRLSTLSCILAEVCPFEKKSLISFFSLATNRDNWPFHIILSNEMDQLFEIHRTN